MPDAQATLPRALLVTRNFPPLVGGMENLNQQILIALAQRWSVSLIGPTGCGRHASEAAEVSETPLRPLAWFFVGSTARALWYALTRRPRLVLAGSGLCAPIAWAASRLSRGRLVVYLHGLDLIVPSPVYQQLWLPFIRRCDLAIVNSRHTRDLALAQGLASDRITILNPGAYVPTLDAGAAEAFRRATGLDARPILLSVGRLTRRKGLAEFVRYALPGIVAQHPQATLVIVGGEASDALHGPSDSEQGRIEHAAAAGGMSGHVHFAGRLDAEQLRGAYQASQAHVFPVLEQRTDVEGFGMVALESAAHGLATVAFAVGGVPDAVSDPLTGTLVASGDYTGFAQAVIDLLARPVSLPEQLARQDFARSKDWNAFASQLLLLLAGEEASA